MINKFSGNTLAEFIYTFPPAPCAATALSFTVAKPIPCSKIINRLDSNETNLTISPYSRV
jgi:hypothetical protein